jgi:hypothetical protein
MNDYNSKNVHIIVHGQRQFFELVKSKLSNMGFDAEKLKMADLNNPGNKGDYVAMLWPPMSPKEIILSEITDLKDGDTGGKSNDGGGGRGMGAWTSVQQKEIDRIPLQ